MCVTAFCGCLLSAPGPALHSEKMRKRSFLCAGLVLHQPGGAGQGPCTSAQPWTGLVPMSELSSSLLPEVLYPLEVAGAGSQEPHTHMYSRRSDIAL